MKIIWFLNKNNIVFAQLSIKFAETDIPYNGSKEKIFEVRFSRERMKATFINIKYISLPDSC